MHKDECKRLIAERPLRAKLVAWCAAHSIMLDIVIQNSIQTPYDGSVPASSTAEKSPSAIVLKMARRGPKEETPHPTPDGNFYVVSNVAIVPLDQAKDLCSKSGMNGPARFLAHEDKIKENTQDDRHGLIVLWLPAAENNLGWNVSEVISTLGGTKMIAQNILGLQWPSVFAAHIKYGYGVQDVRS